MPKESIKIRLIANSNKDEDQAIKRKIRKEIENILIPKTKYSNSIKETRDIIDSNLPEIESAIKKYNVNYEINYGNNFFPTKEYKGIKYKNGTYESLVIKLGEAVGDNWWCVLFPPLCLIEEEENNITNVEYKLFFKSIISKF